MQYKRIGIVAKPKIEIKQYIEQSIDILKELGVEIILSKTSSEILGLKQGIARDDIGKECDLILVLGGDGTLLSAVNTALNNNIPIAGVNLGTRGFLTRFRSKNLEESLNDILSGKLELQERKLLETSQRGKIYRALNDIIIKNSELARIINVQIKINNKLITKFRADGLIVSTPTGSTAYSLSAGGPIISPEINGIIITPVCPLTLNFRPLIVPDNAEISIKINNPNKVMVTIDGQKGFPMPKGFITIKSCEKKISLIKPKDLCYYSLLSKKLGWGV